MCPSSQFNIIKQYPAFCNATLLVRSGVVPPVMNYLSSLMFATQVATNSIFIPDRTVPKTHKNIFTYVHKVKCFMDATVQTG